MVKVKTISRTDEEFFRARPSELPKVHRNLDPSLHKLERPREYIRAVNAAKLDRVFSKPFVGSLNGHMDSPVCLARHPSSVSVFASGGADGELKLWNLTFKTNMWSTKGHRGFVKGMGILHEGTRMISCGTDSTIKMWDIDVLGKRISSAYHVNSKLVEDEDETEPENREAVTTWSGESHFGSLDVHVNEDIFATSSATKVQLWDVNHSSPIQTLEWGNDSVTCVRWGKIQSNLIAATAMDRSICFFDTRADTPIKRVFLPMNTNAISWNPMQAYYFVAASEDHNLYTFDIRNLNKANIIHEDHVSAVMDVDYSPTGTEIVSGSFDQTVRVWKAFEPRSRDVYHTKRMQRILQTKFSGDSRFILSGSDDTNIRIWKTEASSTLRIQSERERANRRYVEALKARFSGAPQIRKMAKHKYVPKSVFKAKQLKITMSNAQHKKDINVIMHSAPKKHIPKENKVVILDHDDFAAKKETDKRIAEKIEKNRKLKQKLKGKQEKLQKIKQKLSEQKAKQQKRNEKKEGKSEE